MKFEFEITTKGCAGALKSLIQPAIIAMFLFGLYVTYNAYTISIASLAGNIGYETCMNQFRPQQFQKQ